MGLGSSLSHLRLPNREKEETVKCGLESEIKLVLKLTAITCSMPLLGNHPHLSHEGDILNLHAS